MVELSIIYDNRTAEYETTDQQIDTLVHELMTRQSWKETRVYMLR
jgi:hypothetical protein